MFRRKEVLVEVICGLGNKESYEINKLEERRKNAFESKDLPNQNIGIGW